MVLGNAGLSDDVPFVDEESRSSGGCLVPVLRDCPAVQAHLRGAYTYFETAVLLVGGALPDEMNPFCSPWWEVFSGNAATALGAFWEDQLKHLALSHRAAHRPFLFPEPGV